MLSPAVRRWLGFGAKLAVSASLIWLLSTRVNFGAVFDRLKLVGALELGAVLALTFLGAALAAWRWRLIASAFGHVLPYPWSLKVLLIGMFFNQTLPSSVGGDAVRIWYLGRHEHAFADAVTIVLGDRIVAMIMLLLMTAVSLPFLLPLIPSTATRATLIAMVAGGGVGAAVLFIGGLPLVRLVARSVPVVDRLVTRLGQVAAQLQGRVVLGSVLSLSLVLHALTALTVFAIAQGMNLAVSAYDCLLLIPPVLLISVMPITVAGWGVRESAMVSAFALVGVGAEDALSLSILFGLSGILGGIPGGLLWLADTLRRPSA
jgi:uncharacterized membrane protein YbhN (UPF0104 family)